MSSKIGTIDIVINAAVIVDELDYVNSVQVNLLGVMHGIHVALNHMAIEKGGKGGIICNISSMLGLDGSFCIPTYTATKHALVGYAMALSDKRIEHKYGVKFVTICPGFTDTKLSNKAKLLSDDFFAAFQRDYGVWRSSKV